MARKRKLLARDGRYTEVVRSGRATVRVNANMLRALRNYAENGSSLNLDEFSGPLWAKLVETRANPEAAAVLHERMHRWARYFRTSLDDLFALERDIDSGALEDPLTLLQVVRMSDQLVDTATDTAAAAKDLAENRRLARL
jgi:hypothetical protein